MKILFKYATRQRPAWFKNTLLLYYSYMSWDKFVHRFVITLDEDDDTMNNEAMRLWMQKWPNLEWHYGRNENKIEAINADIYDWRWDILFVVSDDMIPVVKNFDSIVVRDMKRYFPKLDGALHYDDGLFGKDKCITLSIMGRELYRQLGYVYHPDYVSFYCDNEFTDVVYGMGKAKYVDRVIVRHEWKGGPKSEDALYRRNSKMGSYMQIDQKTYELRKKLRFPKERKNVQST